VTGHYTQVKRCLSLKWMPAVGITDGPPPCVRDHWAVVLSCSHRARRWATLKRRSAWLVIDTQVKAHSRETHSPSRASKTYGHKAFQITHTPLLSTVVALHYSPPHTFWGCAVELASALTVATILADTTVTPRSPK